MFPNKHGWCRVPSIGLGPLFSALFFSSLRLQQNVYHTAVDGEDERKAAQAKTNLVFRET